MIIALNDVFIQSQIFGAGVSDSARDGGAVHADAPVGVLDSPLQAATHPRCVHQSQQGEDHWGCESTEDLSWFLPLCTPPIREHT